MKKVVRYNKLVRDKIPGVIQAAGWRPYLKVLKKGEFLAALKKKVAEEAKELELAKNKKDIMNEIADLQELIDAILAEAKIPKAEIKEYQTTKRMARGGFKKRLFLVKEEK